MDPGHPILAAAPPEMPAVGNGLANYPFDARARLKGDVLGRGLLGLNAVAQEPLEIGGRVGAFGGVG
jgi:hypothetical protein